MLRYRPTALLVILVLAAGSAIRLAYASDIEFKSDERWSFDQARTVLNGGPWPALGLPMSVGGRNPGLSAWIFVALAWISDAETPPELARAVQATNSLALLAFVLFAWLSVRPSDREPWLWGAMVWAANPAAVIYERKIWPPSILPLFTVGLIAAWWHRRTWVASFLFAAIAALMSQIHPLLTVLAGSFLIWGLIEDRSSFRWSGLILGGVLGALPAIPWFLALFESNAGSDSQWRMLPLLGFYRRWLLQPFGFSAYYTIGMPHFRTFLAWPVVGGVPTYLVGLSHVALMVTMVALYFRAIRAARLSRWFRPAAVFGGSEPAGRLVRATLWGFGGTLTLITLTGVGAERHYMISIAPIMALWVGLLAAFPTSGHIVPATRGLLAVCCAGQLLVSALLLDYIHHAKVTEGYGATWAAQQEGLAPPPPLLKTTP